MQNNDLKISLFQSDLIWEKPEKNISKLEKRINDFSESDILICTEMFTTGFSMNVKNNAETHPGKSLEKIQQIAQNSDTAIVLSMMVEDDGKYYNRLYFVFPDGKYQQYDKKHLFTMGEEHKHYTAGKDRLVVDYKGWKILPLVCYDLRFPVWSRNVEEYELAIYVANWPGVRADVWKTLLKARALENQCYVAGVNRIGVDGRDLKYTGDSRLFSPKGEIICDCRDEEVILTEEISKEELYSFREKFPVLKDGDSRQ